MISKEEKYDRDMQRPNFLGEVNKRRILLKLSSSPLIFCDENNIAKLAAHMCEICSNRFSQLLFN